METESKKIDLTKDMKVYLLTSLKRGYIEINDVRKMLGITRPEIIVQVNGTLEPFPNNENDVI